MKDWAQLSDEELLEERFCDLQLTIAGSELESRINQLYQELSAKGLLFHPLCYVADEWFVPEGDTVIGVPFYLTHPRLKKLEQKMMLEVEGESPEECMKILRHEVGHAIYYAFKLSKNKPLRKIFQHDAKNGEKYFRPKPYSRSYVLHIDNWYAQTEPDEDFAETFAVWLTPNFDWQKYYEGWKALEKLKFMDLLMNSLKEKRPPHITQDRPFATSRMRLKLKTFYQRKRKELEEEYPEFYDRDLKRIFSLAPEFQKNELARGFLTRYRKRIVDTVSSWTGERKFIINTILKDIIDRCQALCFRLSKGEMETVVETTAYMTSIVSNRLFTGKLRKRK